MAEQRSDSLSTFGDRIEALFANHTDSIEKAHHVLKEEVRRALRDFLGRDLTDDIMPARADNGYSVKLDGDQE